MCLRNSDKVGDDFGFVRVVRKAVDGNGRDARWASGGRLAETVRPTVSSANPKTKAAGRGKFFCPPAA